MVVVSPGASNFARMMMEYTVHSDVPVTFELVPTGQGGVVWRGKRRTETFEGGDGESVMRWALALAKAEHGVTS